MKTDQEIREDVVQELRWQPMIHSPESIGVASTDGAVTLSGEVPSYYEKVATYKAAERVYGVKSIADEVEVRLAGGPRSDSDIATAIAHVLENTTVGERQVQARVERGRVILEGTVDYSYQRHEIERMVRHVRGVIGINNLIDVRPKVTAEQVELKIADSLRRNADVESGRIRVEVTDHIAQLYGYVHTLHEARIVELATAAAPGITNVENHLAVIPWDQ
jgi:osmotically-inducible protein OsmY